MKNIFVTIGVIACLFFGMLGGASATVISGSITNWEESGNIFSFDDYVSESTDLQAWWSINQLNPDRGWFYGFNSSTEVAVVSGISSIADVTDASVYSYSSWADGPANEGDFVFFHNTFSGYYGAFLVEDIYGNSNPEIAYNTYLDATWYFQDNGTENFSIPVPEPATLLLLGTGLAGLAFRRRKQVYSQK